MKRPVKTTREHWEKSQWRARYHSTMCFSLVMWKEKFSQVKILMTECLKHTQVLSWEAHEEQWLPCTSLPFWPPYCIVNWSLPFNRPPFPEANLWLMCWNGFDCEWENVKIQHFSTKDKGFKKKIIQVSCVILQCFWAVSNNRTYSKSLPQLRGR